MKVGGLMAYIDSTYYKDEFHGTLIPDDQFERLASIASDLIDCLVSIPIVSSELSAEAQALLKRACAYQTEHLFNTGGIDAINGMSELGIGSESLGSYSVSNGSGSSAGAEASLAYHGIPISALAVSMLKRAGLMSRWVYKGTRLDNG